MLNKREHTYSWKALSHDEMDDVLFVGNSALPTMSNEWERPFPQTAENHVVILLKRIRYDRSERKKAT